MSEESVKPKNTHSVLPPKTTETKCLKDYSLNEEQQTIINVYSHKEPKRADKVVQTGSSSAGFKKVVLFGQKSFTKNKEASSCSISETEMEAAFKGKSEEASFTTKNKTHTHFHSGSGCNEKQEHKSSYHKLNRKRSSQHKLDGNFYKSNNSPSHGPGHSLSRKSSQGSTKAKSNIARKKLEVELKAAEEIAKIKETVIEKRLALELASLEDGMDHFTRKRPAPSPVCESSTVCAPSPVPAPSPMCEPSNIRALSTVCAPPPVPPPSSVPAPLPVCAPTTVSAPSPVPAPSTVCAPSPVPPPSSVPAPSPVCSPSPVRANSTVCPPSPVRAPSTVCPPSPVRAPSTVCPPSPAHGPSPVSTPSPVCASPLAPAHAPAHVPGYVSAHLSAYPSEYVLENTTEHVPSHVSEHMSTLPLLQSPQNHHSTPPKHDKFSNGMPYLFKELPQGQDQNLNYNCVRNSRSPILSANAFSNQSPPVSLRIMRNDNTSNSTMDKNFNVCNENTNQIHMSCANYGGFRCDDEKCEMAIRHSEYHKTHW